MAEEAVDPPKVVDEAQGEPAASEETGAVQEASEGSKAPERPAAEQLEELVAQATAKYAVKDYRNAAELYSRATELQAEINGEMSPENADLLYSYGRCLYHVAVLNSEVLGSKLAGESKDAPSKSSKSKAADKPAPPTEKETEETKEMVAAIVEEKQAKEDGGATGEASGESKPYFVFQGDEGYDESDEDEEGEEGGDQQEDDDDDDFQNAFEVLDLARVLLQRQLEEKKAAGADAKARRQIEERLADTYDLQAEISLEGEQFANAATDLRSSLGMKQELYAFESSLIAEAHYKLSLALEFAAVTHHKDASGEIDASQPAIVDQKMRNEAADQMEKAIGSCKSRISQEEKKLADAASGKDDGAAPKGKVTRQSIDEVKEMVEDMEQRLTELRQAPVTVNDPRGTGAPEGSGPLNGILGEMLGESPEAQKKRLEEAMKGANDLSGLVKRKKRKADDAEPAGSGTGTPEKRARTEEAETAGGANESKAA